MKAAKHYFNAPDEDKKSRFCRCGEYLTSDIHERYNEPIKTEI